MGEGVRVGAGAGMKGRSGTVAETRRLGSAIFGVP